VLEAANSGGGSTFSGLKRKEGGLEGKGIRRAARTIRNDFSKGRKGGKSGRGVRGERSGVGRTEKELT